ncbi:beta strand repeat-containing protein [Flavobacterium chilense]|uniref:Head domain of trimeric autotransporter adhesin n=1 Tax=Flavobacterium chilense TaxID=946677 RepID=A0A1M7F4K6_9FLAO|nr:hypothetical protein [Flavobacterium chilense]SHL98920.1 hypothetical protein SAMN05444484_103220 [Flavobacterium chilense]
MKSKLLLVVLFLISFATYSQVGIGTLTPSSSAQLEVTASDKGVLIPRLNLTGSTDATTITSGNINSLLVFNTATVSDIKPGYYYWYENKWNRIIISSEVSTSPGTVIYNPTTQVFSYIDVSGNTQVIDINTIVKANETITTLVNNGGGSYTYTNESGTAVNIDVTGDVTTNFNTIASNPVVTNIIKDIVKKTEGNVTFDSITNEFKYVDVSGNTQIVNMNTIVKANETVTTQTQDLLTGAITYTNEAGTTSTSQVKSADAANILTVGTDGGTLLTPTTITAATTVSNTSTGNNLSTTVNGKTGTGVNIINNNETSLAGTTLITTVNGVASTALDLAPAISAGTTNTLSLLGNTLTSNVNGVSSTSDAVSGVSNASNINTATVTVNGITSTGASIVNSNETSLTGTSLTTTVNGVASTALDLAPAISAGTTNTLSLLGNTLTSSVNGISSTSDAVSGVSNTSNINTSTVTVNGITSTGAPIVNSNETSLTGTSLTTTVNGVTSTALDLSPAISAGTTNTLSLLGNTLTSNVNGISSTSDAVSGVSNASNINTSTVTVNGITSTGAPIVNSNETSLTGTSLTTTVNGVASTPLDLSPAISAGTTNTLSLLGNTLTSNVNGISSTSDAVSGVSNTSNINTSTVTVNGITSSGAPIINSNTLTATNGNLVSTVNGVATTPSVSVLISANNGLTATNGNVQLGGSLTNPTTIVTDAANTLAISGLPTGNAGTDNILVINPTSEILKTVTPSLSPMWALIGNTGTNPAINFLGTTDDQPLKFKIDNSNAGSITKLNTSLGYMALNSLTPGKVRNTAIGISALTNNTDGESNTAVGYNALTANTTGLTNTAVGALSLRANTTGIGNSAFGQNSSSSVTTGNYNNSFGYASLAFTTTGVNNSAFGFNSLNSNIDGSNNSAFGTSSLRANTSGISNIAMGFNSLGNSTTGSYNIGVGYFGGVNTNGNNNIAIGYYSVYDPVNYNTAYTGNKNIVIGDQLTLSGFAASNELNIGNTLFGTGINGTIATPTGKIGINVQNPSAELDVNGQARVRNLPTVTAPTTDNLVTADASGNLHQRTVADAVGTIGWLTTGNTGTNPATNFLGTTDDKSLMFKVNGAKSGIISTPTTFNNTGFGYQALQNIVTTTTQSTSSIDNTAVGSNALAAYNVAGNGSNTAVGSSALKVSLSNANTAVGASAMGNFRGTSGAGGWNTAVGYLALVGAGTTTLNTGINNVALGVSALNTNQSGQSNVAVGSSALSTNISGSNNTVLGTNALNISTAGNYNVAIGASTGTGNLIGLTTGSNNILIGGSSVNIINASTQTVSNEMNIGNTLFGTGVNGAAGGTAGRIGVNTNAPGTTLDVNGQVTVRTLSTGTALDNVVVADATTGLLKKISQTTYAEPWQVENSTTLATANTQNIYQNANVGIGDFNAAVPLTNLDVRGSVRTGSPNTAAIIGSNSFAGGTNSVASSPNSFAFGSGATASGTTGSSAAFGGATANAPNGFAFAAGSATASATFSTAFGNATTLVAGNSSFAAGNGNKVYANNAAAVGVGNTINITPVATVAAAGSFAAGNLNTINSPNSVALGSSNTMNSTYANPQGSVALGVGNSTDGNASIAMGANNKSFSDSSIAMGNNNQIATTSNYSVSMGLNNTINAGSPNALAVGLANTITGGTNSAAIGQNNTISTSDSVIIGTYSSVPSPNNGSTILTDVSNSTIVAATAPNQFTSLFNGGYRFLTNRNNQTNRGVFINDDNTGTGRAKVGINNPTPNADLDVQGSQVVKVANVSGNYTVKTNDYMLVATAAGTNTITLPVAAANTGRVLIIKISVITGSSVTVNTSSAAEKFDGSWPAAVIGGSPTIAGSTSIVLGASGVNDHITVISDGTSWYVSN